MLLSLSVQSALQVLPQIYVQSSIFFCSGLQNDHKALMVEIEQALHALHGIERQQREQGTYNPIANGSSNGAASIPFAKVDLVSQGSPAEKAVSLLCIM